MVQAFALAFHRIMVIRMLDVDQNVWSTLIVHVQKHVYKNIVLILVLVLVLNRPSVMSIITFQCAHVLTECMEMLSFNVVQMSLWPMLMFHLTPAIQLLAVQIVNVV